MPRTGPDLARCSRLRDEPLWPYGFFLSRLGVLWCKAGPAIGPAREQKPGNATQWQLPAFA
jgi:hypothetical protein